LGSTLNRSFRLWILRSPLELYLSTYIIIRIRIEHISTIISSNVIDLEFDQYLITVKICGVYCARCSYLWRVNPCEQGSARPSLIDECPNLGERRDSATPSTSYLVSKRVIPKLHHIAAAQRAARQYVLQSEISNALSQLCKF
jgi:hypothetical protein